MNWYRSFKFVRQNEPLAALNTYRIGGNARFYAEPPDAWALGKLLERAACERIQTYFLGKGTNLLVSDAGVDGLVLRLPRTAFGFLKQTDRTLHVGAGHSLPALVKWTAMNGLRGLECLQGVPGTVGAALRMNAGGKYGEISSSVRLVRGFERDGTPFEFSARECGFVYRGSNLHTRIVTDCELELETGDPELSHAQMEKILREKCASQPVFARSAGCVFKNPKTPGVPPAGKLIDDLGLKGTRIGGASVSNMHANFLICDKGATAADLAALIRLIRKRVQAERGVMLEMEIETWGFTPGQLQTA